VRPGLVAAVLAVACARPPPRADAQPAARCVPAPVDGPVAPVARALDRADQRAVELGPMWSSRESAAVNFAFVVLRVDVTTAAPLPPSRRTLSLVASASRTRFAPAVIACETLALRVDGAEVPLDSAEASAAESLHGDVLESLRARVPPSGYARLGAARCASITLCGRVFALFPAQLAALRALGDDLAAGRT
jgi:hypothetical protein